MHEQPQIEIPGTRPPDRGPFGFAILVAAAAVIIVLAAFYLLPGRQSPTRSGAQEVRTVFGPSERAYASKITIENLALSRAENFLNQEVTILGGEVVNTGERTLSEIELTAEFSDDMNQIALREARLALTSANPPLKTGERRSFEISFEHLPATWNMRQPVVRVSGLLFASAR